ncbi:MAG: hypothetical protein PHH49_04605 [Candidatus Omnitrophica bacterium]|nr:hypothetical protein [Candidatus Omnitrophota bacterium]MDD5488228.1 hypothetical protein [Candidatus Omnitrophota bacterium]
MTKKRVNVLLEERETLLEEQKGLLEYMGIMEEEIARLKKEVSESRKGLMSEVEKTKKELRERLGQLEEENDTLRRQRQILARKLVDLKDVTKTWDGDTGPSGVDDAGLKGLKNENDELLKENSDLRGQIEKERKKNDRIEEDLKSEKEKVSRIQRSLENGVSQAAAIIDEKDAEIRELRKESTILSVRIREAEKENLDLRNSLGDSKTGAGVEDTGSREDIAPGLEEKIKELQTVIKSLERKNLSLREENSRLGKTAVKTGTPQGGQDEGVEGYVSDIREKNAIISELRGEKEMLGKRLSIAINAKKALEEELAKSRVSTEADVDAARQELKSSYDDMVEGLKKENSGLRSELSSSAGREKRLVDELEKTRTGMKELLADNQRKDLALKKVMDHREDVEKKHKDLERKNIMLETELKNLNALQATEKEKAREEISAEYEGRIKSLAREKNKLMSGLAELEKELLDMKDREKDVENDRVKERDERKEMIRVLTKKYAKRERAILDERDAMKEKMDAAKKELADIRKEKDAILLDKEAAEKDRQVAVEEAQLIRQQVSRLKDDLLEKEEIDKKKANDFYVRKAALLENENKVLRDNVKEIKENMAKKDERTKELLSGADDMKAELEKVSREKRALLEEIDTLKASMEKIMSEKDGTYATVESLQGKILALEKERDDMGKELEGLRARNSVDIDAKLREAEGVISEKQESINTLLADIKEKQEEAERLSGEKDALVEKMKETLKEKYLLENKARDILKEKYVLEEELAAVRAGAEKTATNVEEFSEKAGELGQQNAVLSREVRELEGKLDDISRELEMTEQENEGLNADIKEYQAQINGFSAERERLNAQIRAIRGQAVTPAGGANEFESYMSKMDTVVAERVEAERKLAQEAFDRKIEAYKKEVGALRAQLDAKGKDSDTRVDVKGDYERQMKEKDGKIKDYEDALSKELATVRVLQRKLNDTRKKLADLGSSFEATITDKQNIIDRTGKDLAAARSQEKDIKEKYQKVMRDLSSALQGKSSLEKKLKAYGSEIDRMKKKIRSKGTSDSREPSGKLEREVRALRDENSELKQRLDILQKEIEELRMMNARSPVPVHVAGASN